MGFLLLGHQTILGVCYVSKKNEEHASSELPRNLELTLVTAGYCYHAHDNLGTLRRHATNLLCSSSKDMLHCIIQIYKWNEKDLLEPSGNRSREESERCRQPTAEWVSRGQCAYWEDPACIWTISCWQGGLLNVLCTGYIPMNASLKSLVHDRETQLPKVRSKRGKSKANSDKR